MRLHHTRWSFSALVLTALLSAPVGGCARAAAPASSAPAAITTVANVTQMTAAEKTSQIATSFPLQVPVASGAVVRGESQGDSAWVYEVIVADALPGVRNWYVQAYRNAEWAVTSSTDSEVTLVKGGAQSRLKFENVDTGNEARTQVTAVVGVGTQVLQTE